MYIVYVFDTAFTATSDQVYMVTDSEWKARCEQERLRKKFPKASVGYFYRQVA